MAEEERPFAILLDQNLSREVADWLRGVRPGWRVLHTTDLGLQGAPDPSVFAAAQTRGAVIVSYDEDFADQHSYPVGRHAGVVRLRVWPTTVEEACTALARVFTEIPEDDLRGALVIVERQRIRLRKRS